MKALQLAGNPQAVAQATEAAAAQMKSSPEGASMLGAGGVTAPTGQGTVQAQGNADVNRLAANGRAAAAKANAGNQAGVQAKQPASASSSPDTSGATAAFNSTAGAAYSNYQALTGDANFSQGRLLPLPHSTKMSRRGGDRVVQHLSWWGRL